MENNITGVYYTSNHLEEKNPYFLENTKEQLRKAAKGLPMVIVSQKPTVPFTDNCVSICLENIGRSHLNIYRQILEGAKAAETDWVAMLEDDILYSAEHLKPWEYIKNPQLDTYYFDMNKVSIFTWIKPALFSFRFKREVVNQLIAPRKMLIENLEMRFAKVEELKKIGWPEEKIIKYFGDPGRYDELIGLPTRKKQQVSCKVPSIVFSHNYAFGYENNQGKRKRLGDLRIIELDQPWGRADQILKLYDKNI